MDNMKIGSFISELRREQGMTQRELSEKLNVTDKAVSKWERGQGYPEITMIPKLADLLGVSAGELLLGERETAQASDHKQSTEIAVNTIEYVKQAQVYKASKASQMALNLLTLLFLTAAFVCMLCNYVINKTFDWSLYVVGSEIVAWLTAYPFLARKKRRYVISLTAFSVTVLPLLMLIEYLCPVKNWVFPFALTIVAISLFTLWLLVLLFVYTKINRWYLASFSCIVGSIVNFSINSVVSRFCGSPDGNIANSIIEIVFVFSALVLAVIGRSKRRDKAA